MTPDERAKLAAWMNDAYRHDFQLRMPPEIGALVGRALGDIERLERSKRILEGDYNKLHDELISAESDAREAVKTRDRVLARIEWLETALRNLCDRLDEIGAHPSYKSLFTMTFIHGGGQYNGPNWAEPYERAREALTATTKEATDET